MKVNKFKGWKRILYHDYLIPYMKNFKWRDRWHGSSVPYDGRKWEVEETESGVLNWDIKSNV